MTHGQDLVYRVHGTAWAFALPVPPPGPWDSEKASPPVIAHEGKHDYRLIL